MELRIATRRSKLAQVQADTIGNMLREKCNVEYKKVLIETAGDRILDKTLNDIGGKGLFIKDIEVCMQNGGADGAVHSMKDVPYEVPEGFEIASMPLREDVRDVFVSQNDTDFYNLPQGATVGTSSIRRAKQIKMLRPDIEIVPIRGNIQTRIEKLKRENLDGMILAAAGLKRLDMENYIKNYFDPLEFIPAVGQGTLGIEIVTGSPTAEIFKSIDSFEIRTCVECERSFMRRLNGDCHTTVGAYAKIDGSSLYVVGLYEVSGKLVKKDIIGNVEDHVELGIKLAEKILE